MTEKETGVGTRVYLSGEPNPADYELYINKKPETCVLLGKILDGSATSEDRARLELLATHKASSLKFKGLR